MKRKILILLIVVAICASLAALTETIFFNYKALTISNKEQLSELSFSTKTNNGTTLVNTQIDSTYINKLIINYHSEKRVEYSLSYTYEGPYGDKTTEQTKTDFFDASLSKSITNIGKKVSSITIVYDNNNDTIIDSIFIDNCFHFNYFRAIFIFLVLITLSMLFWFYKNGFKTEKIHIYFATICTLTGLMVIVSQPAATFYSWDDQIHFDNTVTWFGGTTQYSNGEYNLSNANISESTGRDAVNSFDEKQMQIEYLNADIEHNFKKDAPPLPALNKISYLPMAISYNAAKLLHLPFVSCFIIGKIFNLLSYALLTAYAIKTCKIGKRLLSVISLMPINVFLASNYSYDPSVFAGIAVLSSHLVNLMTDKQTRPSFKNTAIIILSASYACLAKAVYSPLLLLTVLIPKEKFSTKKQSLFVKIGFTGIMLLLLTFPIISGGISNDPRGGDTSVTKQASSIIEHPLDYTATLKDTMVDQFSMKLFGPYTTTSYSYLGKMDEKSNLYFLLLFLLFFVFITDNKNNILTKKNRFSILAISIAIITLIWTTLYLSFTPVGSNNINGVQGRYFLPILFILLLAIQPTSIQNKINAKVYNCIIISIPALIIIISVYLLILMPFSF